MKEEFIAYTDLSKYRDNVAIKLREKDGCIIWVIMLLCFIMIVLFIGLMIISRKVTVSQQKYEELDNEITELLKEKELREEKVKEGKWSIDQMKLEIDTIKTNTLINQGKIMGIRKDIAIFYDEMSLLKREREAFQSTVSLLNSQNDYYINEITSLKHK